MDQQNSADVPGGQPLLRVLCLAMAIIAGYDCVRFATETLGLPSDAMGWGLHLYNLFVLAGCAVAALLAIRWPAASASRLLPLGLACAASVWTTRLLVAFDPTFRDSYRLVLSRAGMEWFGGELLTSLFMWVSAAAFLRFSTLFPRPLSREEYFTTQLFQGDDAVSKADKELTERISNLFRALPGRHTRLGEILSRPVPNKNPLTWLWSLGVEPRLVWSLSLGIGIVLSPPLLGGGDPGLSYMTESILFPLVAAGALLNFFLGYERADPDDRRRLLWVNYGFTLGFIFLILGVFSLLFLETGREVFVEVSMSYRGERALMPLLISPAAPPLIATILMATFYYGAFDPTLAIKKTTVFGSLGLLFLFLFAGFGNAAEGFLESTLGMPPLAGAIFTGGTIAVILIPVKRRMDGFVNRILPATVLSEAPTATVAVLFSDIVGYTHLTREDQNTALTVMTVFHRVADRVARENRGRLVKSVADEVVLEFEEARDGVQAASELEAEFHEEARKLDLPTPELRTGMHLGPVTRAHDGDLFGDTVNIASKIHTSAEPGEIVLSAAIADGLDGFTLESLGPRELKGASEAMECYRVLCTESES